MIRRKADGIDFVYVRVGYTGYTKKKLSLNYDPNYQENIICFLKELIYNSGMSLIDFAKYIDINSQNLDSILQKKRFIELNELISISEKFKISVNDIIGA